MFKTMENYKNRQMIINEYMDEELIKRNGFFFNELLVTDDNKIKVYKKNQLLYELAIPNRFHLRKDGSFPNYFVMEWETFRTEIYFP